MTHLDILKDIKNKIYKPIYLLTGEEPYYIDIITNYIAENILNETEKTFNQTILYGKDTEIIDLINASRKFPMMSNQQVVIVREAQELKNINLLLPYIENPLQSTILIIAYKVYKDKKIKKSTKLFKVFAKNGIVFESKKLYENQIPDWISKYLKNKGCTIAPEASILLAEYLGIELSKIANELEKLIITLPKDHRHITPALIERNIGISKDFNSFELTKALGTKNIFKANLIINYFAQNPKDNPINLVLGIIHSYFRKLFQYHILKDKGDQNLIIELKIPPFFINDYKRAASKYNPKKIFEIFGWIRECDVKSKGMGNSTTSDGDLLKELTFKILH